MSALLRTPARRLAFFAAASLLLHAAVLVLPQYSLPRNEAPLPLLAAKLVPIPRTAHAPNQHAKPAAPRPAPRPPQPIAQNMAAASSVPPAAASSVAAEAAANASAVAAAASAVPATVDYAATSAHAPPLPKHARLLYVAQMGALGLYVGEIRHELEIDAGQYTLHAELRTTGLASLVKHYQNIQDSRGSVSAKGGLRPGGFSEAKTDEHGTQSSEAVFDWDAHQLAFASGTKVPLPDGAQDILSFLYQLSQLPFDREVIPLAVSNGRKLEFYKLATGPEEAIDTPMGKLRALHLSKQHAAGEEGTEIWLALEYRLLPVKVRHIERDGKVAGEIVIKEIRLSDE